MDNENAIYEQQEDTIRTQTEAFLKMLTKQGILGDRSIKDENVRQVQRKKKQNAYHNTLLLLKNYRMISWVIECFPDVIAEELERPFQNTDELLDHVDIEVSLGNRKLESRLAAAQRSRLLLDRVNEALTVLRKKPDGGERLYDLLYLTYISPEQLTLQEILYRLDISARQYYRLRGQAVTIMSIRLWAAPVHELDCWLEVLTAIEDAG